MSRIRIILVGLALVTFLNSADAQIIRRRARRRAIAPRVAPQYLVPNSVIYEEVVERSSRKEDGTKQPGDDTSNSDSKSDLKSSSNGTQVAAGSNSNAQSKGGAEAGAEAVTQSESGEVAETMDDQVPASSTKEWSAVKPPTRVQAGLDPSTDEALESITTADVNSGEADGDAYVAAAAYVEALRETKSSSNTGDTPSSLNWLFLLIPVYCAWLIWMSVRADEAQYAPLLDRMGGTRS